MVRRPRDLGAIRYDDDVTERPEPRAGVRPGAVVFFAAGLFAVFFGAVFFGAAFFGAAFLGAAFLGAAFFGPAPRADADLADVARDASERRPEPP